MPPFLQEQTIEPIAFSLAGAVIATGHSIGRTLLNAAKACPWPKRTPSRSLGLPGGRFVSSSRIMWSPWCWRNPAICLSVSQITSFAHRPGHLAHDCHPGDRRSKTGPQADAVTTCERTTHTWHRSVLITG